MVSQGAQTNGIQNRKLTKSLSEVVGRNLTTTGVNTGNASNQTEELKM